MTTWIDGVIRRRARQRWTCTGDGAGLRYREYAPGCKRTIEPGEEYVEYVGETPAFHSGTRHCMACAMAFFQRR